MESGVLTSASAAGKPGTSGRRRSRRLASLGAAAAATTIVLSVSLASAFHVPYVSRRGPLPGRGAVPPLQSSVLDADVLVQAEAKELTGRGEELFILTTEEQLARTNRSRRKPEFKGILTSTSTSSSRNTSSTSRVKSTSKKTSTSRSSTMPGFASETNKQRAYREGVRLIEQRTGRKIRDTPEARRKRRKENGEAMYKNSAAVPDSLVQFADEIHQEDRITREEEIELGEKTQEAIRLQCLYENLSTKLNREPTDEEWCAEAGKINMEAIRQAIDEGLEAKNKLVTSNLRMVQSVVNTYIRNGLTAQYNAGDMMQEGIMALIRAAEKFEPDRGWKFSTYAMYWVRASVKRSQIFQSRAIPVPQRLYENHKRLKRVERELVGVLGRLPTRKELGEVVGMTELQVDRCFTAMEQTCVSLDSEIKNTLKPMSIGNERNTLIDILESRTDDGEYRRLQRVLLREDLIETLHRHLEPHEVELLLLRYGLKGPSESTGRLMTIAELSLLVGLKPDKVRRTINRSLKQLKSVGNEEWLAFDREM